MADFLQCVEECLDRTFKELPGVYTLVEKKPGGKQQIVLQSGGQKLLYSFDKDKVNLYPYFYDIKGLKSIADYMLFTKTDKGEPYVLIFELKKSNNPVYQLMATKYFCVFLMERINMAQKCKFNPKIRMIGLVENAKGSTNPRNLQYNKRNILTTSIRRLKLEDLLK